jgi:hypothetical protein
MGDEYERAYLGGDEALHREKRVSRQTFGILTTIAVGLGAMAAVSMAAFVSGDPQGLGGAVLLGGIAALNGVLGVALAVTRTVVTPRELRFMVGLRNRTIPLSAITATSIRPTQPTTIRADVAADAAELSAIFGAGQHVRVAWTDESGKARVLWLGSDDAPRLCAAIDRARASTAPPPTRVASDAGASDEEVEADAPSPAARKKLSPGSP